MKPEINGQDINQYSARNVMAEKLQPIEKQKKNCNDLGSTHRNINWCLRTEKKYTKVISLKKICLWTILCKKKPRKKQKKKKTYTIGMSIIRKNSRYERRRGINWFCHVNKRVERRFVYRFSSFVDMTILGVGNKGLFIDSPLLLTDHLGKRTKYFL